MPQKRQRPFLPPPPVSEAARNVLHKNEIIAGDDVSVKAAHAPYVDAARASQTLSKLGGAAVSATADVFIKAMNMRVHGVSWGEALIGSILQCLKGYKGQERIIAWQIGAFVDDETNEMRLRWDASEVAPGTPAGLQDKLFRWSGLNWITETGKAGFATWFSRHYGEVAGLAFDALDAPRRATLEHHGFDAKRWEPVRHMTEDGPGGERLLTPQQAGN